MAHGCFYFEASKSFASTTRIQIYCKPQFVDFLYISNLLHSQGIKAYYNQYALVRSKHLKPNTFLTSITYIYICKYIYIYVNCKYIYIYISMLVGKKTIKIFWNHLPWNLCMSPIQSSNPAIGVLKGENTKESICQQRSTTCGHGSMGKFPIKKGGMIHSRSLTFSPLKNGGWKTIFLLGFGNFSGASC